MAIEVKETKSPETVIAVPEAQKKTVVEEVEHSIDVSVADYTMMGGKKKKKKGKKKKKKKGANNETILSEQSL